MADSKAQQATYHIAYVNGANPSLPAAHLTTVDTLVLRAPKTINSAKYKPEEEIKSPMRPGFGPNAGPRPISANGLAKNPFIAYIWSPSNGCWVATRKSALLALSQFQFGTTGPQSISAVWVLFTTWALCGTANGRHVLPRIRDGGGGDGFLSKVNTILYQSKDQTWPTPGLTSLFVSVFGNLTAARYIAAAIANEYVNISGLLKTPHSISQFFRAILFDVPPLAYLAAAMGINRLESGATRAQVAHLAAEGHRVIVDPYRLLLTDELPIHRVIEVLKTVFERLGIIYNQWLTNMIALIPNRDQSTSARAATAKFQAAMVAERAQPSQAPIIYTRIESGAMLRLSTVGVGEVPLVATIGNQIDLRAIASRRVYHIRECGAIPPAHIATTRSYLIPGDFLQVAALLVQRKITLLIEPHWDTEHGRKIARKKSNNKSVLNIPITTSTCTTATYGDAERVTWGWLAFLTMNPRIERIHLLGAWARAPQNGPWDILIRGLLGGPQVTIITTNMNPPVYTTCPCVRKNAQAFVAEYQRQMKYLCPPPVRRRLNYSPTGSNYGPSTRSSAGPLAPPSRLDGISANARAVLIKIRTVIELLPPPRAPKRSASPTPTGGAKKRRG